MAGCLPDFSPDPINQEVEEAVRDAGTDAGSGGGTKDAASPKDSGGGSVPPRDAAATTDAKTTDPVPSEDGGTVKPPVDQPDAGGGTQEPAGPCDLTGRYLVTERFGMDGLGAKQVVQNWFYVELTQSGEAVQYSKSVSCGASVVGLSPVPVSMDDKQAWPAYAANPVYDGRKGTSKKVADGCAVAFDKDALVRGATVEVYRDLNKALPTLQQQATDTNPGWEDWDDDGKPGVTLRVSGTVQGSLFAVMRNWTVYSGTVPEGAELLTMTLDWGQKRSTLDYDGSPLLTADAAKDPDLTRHSVEFAKLTEEETAGKDDLALCELMRSLAPTRTPKAGAKAQ
jgi:hypothetical protein